MTNTAINFNRFSKCPECGSENIGVEHYIYNLPITVTRFCWECEYSWFEIWDFSHSELPEDEKEF